MAKANKAPTKPPKTKLSLSWETFCLEYIKDFNATRAAIAAGSTIGSAAVLGYRLLRKDKILKRIEELTAGRNQRILLEGDEILGELKRIGDFDPRQIFEDNGTVKDPKDWPIDLAKAISSIEVKEIFAKGGKLIGYTKKVKFWDKTKALELLGKNKKLFVEVTENKNNNVSTPASKEQIKEWLKELDEQY